MCVLQFLLTRDALICILIAEVRTFTPQLAAYSALYCFIA